MLASIELAHRSTFALRPARRRRPILAAAWSRLDRHDRRAVVACVWSGVTADFHNVRC